MKWDEFLKFLMKEFRVSSSTLQNDYSINSSLISNIRTGVTKKPNQKTIQKLERAFNIKIYDSDPEHVTYRKLAQGENFYKIHQYLLLPPQHGNKPITIWDEYAIKAIPGLYDKIDGCFYCEIDNDKMSPAIECRDLLIVDIDAPYKEKEIVILYTNKEYYIGRYNLIDDVVVISFDNSKYQPKVITKNDVDQVFKIVRLVRTFTW